MAAEEAPRTAHRITWLHDRDECVAEVGESLKWRRAEDDKRQRSPGQWSYGRRVIAVVPGPPCWQVVREAGPSDGWANPILCGDQGTIEYEPD